jgi:hypothetical protein
MPPLWQHLSRVETQGPSAQGPLEAVPADTTHINTPRTEAHTRRAKAAVYARAMEGIAQGLDRHSVHGWAAATYGRTLSWRQITDVLSAACSDACSRGIDSGGLDPSWLDPQN